MFSALALTNEILLKESELLFVSYPAFRESAKPILDAISRRS